ncbi:MAG: chorismate synthase [Lentisphaeria bacterium]|nr:chorismate synthase [Lentisphaeria bacterium]
MNNTFGTLFAITTFGESHGPALGVTIDGLPAGLAIDPDFIQSEMDRRRPGQSAATTARKEADKIEILSGVFEGKTTGTPLAMLIRNADQHSADYSRIAATYRPGHADITFDQKFGFRDYRGGGRSSGRETASRVAAGAVAKLLLKHYGIEVRACAASIGNISGDIHKIDWSTVEQNPVRCGDPSAADAMAAAIESAAKDLDSIGGTVYAEITGLPAGLGEPVFDKFDALLAHAMFSIGGVKGLEIGSGFSAAEKRGSENNDPITPEGFATNNAGGILGGISNGDKVTFRVAVKPTPSIYKEQQTIEKATGNATSLVIKGRHDPCLVPRIVPVVEAMAAIVAADLLLRAKTSKLD